MMITHFWYSEPTEPAMTQESAMPKAKTLFLPVPTSCFCSVGPPARFWRFDNTQIVGYRDDKTVVYSGDLDYLSFLGSMNSAHLARQFAMINPYGYGNTFWELDQNDSSINCTAKRLHIIGHVDFSSKTPKWEEQYARSIRAYNDLMQTVLM